MNRILIVDDEENIREIIKMTLRKNADEIFTAESAEAGLEILKENNIDIVISDIKMPGMDGLDFLQCVKKEQPRVEFLMITAHGNMDTVIEAMRLGASDFLSKPFENKILREQVVKLLSIKEKNKEKVSTPNHAPKLEGMIGDSPAFNKCVKRALKSAASDSTILINGDSGTGKEVFARAIHQNSPRAASSFIAVNCGAIPENLIESELFGYEKGAFTGAMSEKPGKFELAQNGTLFLDEIGEMPLLMQVKLLRVLQEKQVDRLGSTAPIDIDFRLVAATNKDLQREIAAGRFREDLFYRLNIIPILLPSLKDREDDVTHLAQHFLNGFNDRYEYTYRFNVKQMSAIKGYTWPGNIRELENIVERSVVLGDGEQVELDIPGLDSDELLLTESDASDETLWVGPLVNHETKAKTQKHTATHATAIVTPLVHKKGFKIKLTSSQILQALKENNGNKSKTSEVLGISRRSLLYKIKEFEIL